jgi:hypothetical protein
MLEGVQLIVAEVPVVTVKLEDVEVELDPW